MRNSFSIFIDQMNRDQYSESLMRETLPLLLEYLPRLGVAEMPGTMAGTDL